MKEISFSSDERANVRVYGAFDVSEGVAIGEIWTTANIVWTAVSSVVFAIFIVIIFVKKDFPYVYEKWNLLRVPEDLKRSEDK